MQIQLNAVFAQALSRAGIVPVLTINSANDGVEVARALTRGGIKLIEITLRTSAGLDVIRRVRAEVPAAVVGAGTVLTPELAEEAIAAGARFLVSPGITPRLIEAAQHWSVPFLPGAATASEAMALSDLGYRVLKFFPAEPAGGASYLKALAAPLPGVMFCPTGGVDIDNARDYLSLPNVAAIGGSWLAPEKVIKRGDWPTIAVLAEQAAGLRRNSGD